ncbi:MAG: DUF1543 domain-containing protein [Acidimicrobiales bacterium]
MDQSDTDNAMKLYVVYLGGDPLPGRLSEDHEVVTVVASDVKEARRAARAKWRGSSTGHVDAVQVLDVVDGFEVRLEPAGREGINTIDVTYEPDGDAEPT